MAYKINIGYACITLGLSDVKLQTCRLKNASEQRIMEIIEHNLDVLDRVIEYNHKHNIRLFRISSDIIPFASHPEVSVKWCEHFKQKIKDIGIKIKDYNIRVSMHPGQYTVLNSPNDDVVDRAVEDLKYHTYFLDCLGTDSSSKVILHIGGIYGDKHHAIKRFIDNYSKLDETIKKRLVIENDDKNYDIEDVLYISEKLDIPVVFDNLHHEINNAKTDKSINEYIMECSKTWKDVDGKQKIHYSQQDKSKTKGAHSKTIKVSKFLEFYNNLPHNDLDIMLEVKDKNISAVKCILSTTENFKTEKLEKEWANYKYYVLGKDQKAYLKIRELLKNKSNINTKEFYEIIEKTLEMQSTTGSEINAIQHVFGYFKHKATDAEKKRILTSIDKYKDGIINLDTVKKGLERLAIKYRVDYIINSYYFVDM